MGDLEGVLPVMMSAAFYRQHRKLISSRQPLVVEGRMSEGRMIGDVILRTEKIWGLL
ncbi:MAG: hypothetical protein KKD28_04240 [Chloroflexi bacterium]|nr:hypothetical protein [Chloroflexota bacterium]